jgi:hypothetical protein
MSYERPTYEELAKDMLLQLIRDTSEECWCAGWLVDLEFILWDAMLTGKANFGWGAANERYLIRMRYLHELAGGWWTLPKGEEFERFVPTEEWLKILSEHRSKSAPDQS